MGIGIVLFGPKDGVILEQALKYVERFTGCARDNAGAIDAPRIGQITIDRKGL
jgi:hypothetical protein